MSGSDGSRVLNKFGTGRIQLLNVPKKSIKFVKDLLNTLLEASWKRTLSFFIVVYFASWTFFAFVYYLIAWAHNDLEFDPVTGKRMNDGHAPCLKGGDSFTGVFLLSMESQVSTGYGEHYPTEECSEAIFALIAQLVCGVIIDGTVLGIFYAKMVRPYKKERGIKFSKKAVICLRDGVLCLIFRVMDAKFQHGIRTKVKAYFMEDKRTLEGEILEKAQSRLELEQNGKLFLIWPETVCHYITKGSPLYNFSAEHLFKHRFEIGVSIVGDSRKTGQFIQSRTSYTPNEILWGHRFVQMIDYDSTYHEYVVDDHKFEEFIAVPTPLCSAKRLEELYAGLKYEPEIEALRDLEIRTHSFIEEEEDDEEEDDEDDDDDTIGYSEETDMDVVPEKPLCNQMTARRITRTTSAIQNYPGNSYYTLDVPIADDHSKSLTHIEREREMKPSSLKKSNKVKFESSNESTQF